MIDAAAIAARVLERVGGRAEAEVRVTHHRSALTRFANSFIHQNVVEEGASVGLRMAVDGRVATAETNLTDDDALTSLVGRALDASRLRPPDPDWPGLTPPQQGGRPGRFDPATADAAPGLRAGLVRDFVAAGEGLVAAGFCETVGEWSTFANSAGHVVSDASTRATIDGIHQAGAAAGSAHQTGAGVGELDAAAAGAVAAAKARAGVDPAALAPGRYPVVLEPDCGSTLLSFLAFYAFNAKQVVEGQSYLELGADQFHPGVDIYDDATSPAAVGIGFDHEGVPKRRVALVTGGRVTGLAHDRRTAAALGAESSGHAIPGGEVWGAVPTNLFLASGTVPAEELIGGVERGLLVTEFNYCRVLDPRTLVITGLTRNGTFLIEDGRLAGPVADLRFTQSLPEALGPAAELAVGNDLRLGDSEFGTGMFAAPSLVLGGWNFTGGARG